MGQIKIKIVKKESFFNFFDTLPFPPVEDLNEEEFEDEDDLLERHKYDFMIANVLRTKVIPKGLLYFLGEDDDDDDDVPPPRRTRTVEKLLIWLKQVTRQKVCRRILKNVNKVKTKRNQSFIF